MDNMLWLLLTSKFEIKRSVINDFIDTGYDFLESWQANVRQISAIEHSQPTYGISTKFFDALAMTLNTSHLQHNMWLYGDPSMINLSLGILYMTNDTSLAFSVNPSSIENAKLDAN